MKRVFCAVAAATIGCGIGLSGCRGGRLTPMSAPSSVSAAEQAAPVAPTDPERTHVVLINGGARREVNYQSHLIHLKQLIELLNETNINPAHIAIFSADGPDPAADLATRDLVEDPRLWLLPGGDAAGSARPDIVYIDSHIDGFTLQPARKDAIRIWFATTGKELHAGDTLLLYVTDHGERNAKDLTNNTISLWKEDLSVNELRELLAQLDPAVRVVQVMSQCFSGAFARTIYTGDGSGEPSGNVCGYYSVTADRPAYGCYPENRGKDGIGHSHQLFEALDVLGALPEANKRIQVTDRTPDVPFASSSFYLDQLLRSAAESAKEDPEKFIDGWLNQAWRDRAAWEPQIRLLDRIGHTFGSFSPRSLHELQAESEALPDFSSQLRTYGQRWNEALEALKFENWNHFLDVQPQWRERFDPKKRAALDAAARDKLLHEVLAALEPFTRTETVRYARLESLRDKADDATGASYRTDVRLGAVLRMQTILISVAGQVYLAQRGSSTERDTYQRLLACEALALGPPATVTSAAALPPPEPFPTLADERSLVEKVMPAWMGIQYKPLPDTQRKQHHTDKGAVAVTTVFPDSAAANAGLQVGDIILGPPSAPFTEPHAVREWTMRSEIGQPAPLRVLREQQTLEITLRPSAFPVKMPKLPGPPPVGSPAPVLKVDLFRGAERVVAGQPKLLFFWATWCVPCKYALPEVLAFAQARGIEVIAVTDEDPEVLNKFFAGRHDPFPEVVAIDPLRITFQSYGVSGTPTFVLVDDHDVVKYYQTGYNADHGLTIDGWNWTPPNKKAAQPAPKTGG
jgi:thiol-disulfide isomerase/thioredoxin